MNAIVKPWHINKSNFINVVIHKINLITRATGIEPVTGAWKAQMLPLHYTRNNFSANLRSICIIIISDLRPASQLPRAGALSGPGEAIKLSTGFE